MPLDKLNFEEWNAGSDVFKAMCSCPDGRGPGHLSCNAGSCSIYEKQYSTPSTDTEERILKPDGQDLSSYKRHTSHKYWRMGLIRGVKLGQCQARDFRVPKNSTLT